MRVFSGYLTLKLSFYHQFIHLLSLVYYHVYNFFTDIFIITSVLGLISGGVWGCHGVLEIETREIEM